MNVQQVFDFARVRLHPSSNSRTTQGRRLNGEIEVSDEA